jgi:hypothetical protein
METHIAILNGNGIHDLARDLRPQLHLEGYGAVAIKNFRDFGVDRTVIYYWPEAERVAASLNKNFFPRAELKPAPQLADSIDIKVVLGHDLGPWQPAEAPQAHGPRLYEPGSAHEPVLDWNRIIPDPDYSLISPIKLFDVTIDCC